jgi:broad-specificity NMP kinase
MRVLIVGTSGSGKSAVCKELKARGYDAIETDTDIFNALSIAYFRDKQSGEGVHMPWPPPKNWHDENDWVWRVDILDQRLQASDKSHVFACGDSRNKNETFKLFDKIFLLKADDKTLRQRILTRGDNYFGKAEDEFAWIIEQNNSLPQEVEAAGGIMIDATQPLIKVVDDILKLVGAKQLSSQDESDSLRRQAHPSSAGKRQVLREKALRGQNLG